MPFQLNCPGCQHTFTVPDSFADKRGKCPKCNSVFRAVRPAAQSSGKQTTSAPKAGPSAAAAGLSGGSQTGQPSGKGPRIPRPKKLETMLPPAEPKSTTAAPPAPKPAQPPAAPKEKKAARKGSESSLDPLSNDPLSTDPLASGPPLVDPLQRPSTAAKLNTPSRGRPSGAGGSNLIRTIVGICLLLIALIVGAAVLGKYYLDNKDAIASRLSDDNQSPPDGGATISTRQPTTPPATTLDADTDPADAPLTAKWDSLKKAIVQVEVLTAGDSSRSGAGVIVDRRGWVATSYHLIDGAKDALLVASDGRRFEVAGIVAAKAEHGLAILQIKDVPSEIYVMPIDADLLPHPRMLVFAGDTSTATPAAVTRMVDTAAIPAKGQLHLSRAMRNGEKVDWIEHTARSGLSGDGTPLLTAEGELVGVNVRLGDEMTHGFAIHAKYLTWLMSEATPEATPFDDTFVADTSPPPPPPAPEVEDLGEPTFGPPPDPVVPGEEVGDGTPRDVADLKFRIAQCEELKWLPKTAEDYAKFQDFALLMHRAAITVKDESAPEELRKSLQETIDTAVKSIEAATWPNKDTMAEVGKLAAELTTGDTPGVFAYCRVDLRPEDLPGAEIDGHPVFGFEIVGTDQMILMPINEGKDEIFTESVRLIIGERDLTTEITISSSDGGEPKPAKLVRAKYLLSDPALQ